MAYATAQDLKDRYPTKDLTELTDPNAASIDDAALDRALADASDEIDGFLMGRYSLPLTQVPRVLTLYACDIAMYRLQALRPQSVTEDSKARYDAAIKSLEKVATGTRSLGVSEAEQPAVQTDGPIVTTATRTFTRDSMRGL